MVRDMTSGKPMRQILSFSVPLLMGSLFQQMYTITDTIIVGQFLGSDALASLGCTGAVVGLIVGFLNGVAEGVCIPVAQYFGAGDEKNLRRSIINIVLVAATVVALLTSIALLTNVGMLRLMKTPEEILPGAAEYLKVVYSGMAITMMYNISTGILRALGDSRTPFYFLVILCVLNILFDILFIVVLDLGIYGVGLASITSQFIATVVCFIYIKKKVKILHLNKQDIVLDKSIVQRISFMSLPIATQYAIISIGSIILQIEINKLGSDAIAAISVAGKIQAIVFILLNAIGVSLSMFCGQNIGAGKLYRVKKGVKGSFILLTVASIVLTVVFYFMGSKAALLFLKPEDRDIIHLVDEFAKLNSLFFWFLAMIVLFRNAVLGLGYGIYSLAGGLIELVGRGVVSLVFIGRFGYTAACLASPVAWVLAGILFIGIFVRIFRNIAKRNPEWAIEPVEEELVIGA